MLLRGSDIPGLCNMLCNSLWLYMLQNYEIPELLQRNALNDVFWMEDGARLHIAKFVCRGLKQHFGDCIISRHFPFNWPTRFLDVTLYEFLVFGMHQIQSLNEQSANFIGFKRLYKARNCKHPSCHFALSLPFPDHCCEAGFQLH